LIAELPSVIKQLVAFMTISSLARLFRPSAVHRAAMRDHLVGLLD
jgi:hypothetical protein